MSLPMVSEPLLAAVKDNLENQTDHLNLWNKYSHLHWEVFKYLEISKQYHDILSMQNKPTYNCFPPPLADMNLSSLSLPPLFPLFYPSSWLQDYFSQYFCIWPQADVSATLAQIFIEQIL